MKNEYLNDSHNTSQWNSIADAVGLITFAFLSSNGMGQNALNCPREPKERGHDLN
jgi:hypothetical protein